MTPAGKLAAIRARLAATEAIIARMRGDAPRTWSPPAIPKPPRPAEPKRAHRCAACRKAGLETLWTCSSCGRQLCEHGLRVHRVDGTGTCRRCAWARARLFRDHFGLGEGGTQKGPAGG